jgi:hypothetical protein
LYFEITAGNIKHFFVTAILDQANRARNEASYQRRVPWHNTKITERAGRDYHLNATRKYASLRAYDVAMHCHRHVF